MCYNGLKSEFINKGCVLSLRIKNILFGYFLFALLSGIALSIWRTVLIVRYYDPYKNEYLPPAEPSLKAFGFLLMFVFIILATSAFFMLRYKFGKFSASEDQFSVFTSALLGFVFLAIAVFISCYFKKIIDIIEYSDYKYIQLISFLLLFCCAAYFIFSAAGHARFENARKALSLATPVWAITFMISSYMDPMYNYGDYNHSLCLVAICALVLFLLYDAGATVKSKATVPYFVFSLISLVASAAYIIPNFILMAYWELSFGLNHILEAALLGTIFYTCACSRKLCLSVKIREKKPTKKNI